MTYIAKVLPAAIILILMISWFSPAMALKPAENVSPPYMDTGYPYPGTITGRITTEDMNQGWSGAYVAIVNAANTTQAFYEGQTDENGFYRFPSVNNTMAGGSPGLLYQVYACLSGTGESISDPFGVRENSTAEVNVIIASSSRTGSGFVVQHIPMPDEIRLSAQPDTIVAGGNESMITAQLYLNGMPYQRSGVTVTFFTDNDTTGYLPTVKKSVTDANGRAMINLTSGNATGDVNVTGFTKIGISRNLTGTCMVHVVNRTADIVTVTNSTALQNATEDLRTNVTLENKTPVDTLATPTPTTSGSSSGVPDAGVILAILAVLVVAAGAVFFLLLKRK